MATFGEKLKIIRENKGITPSELARRAGIPRTTLAAYERRSSDRPSAVIMAKLADALGFTIEDFYIEVGYIKPKSHRRPETPEDILERLKLAQPVSIPVYRDVMIRAGQVHEAPVEYIYRAKGKVAGHNIEAYIVHGHCMEPEINNGDIVVVDRDKQVESGKIILCVSDGDMYLGRLKKIKDEYWLVNGHGQLKLEESQAAAVVIEVIKRVG